MPKTAGETGWQRQNGNDDGFYMLNRLGVGLRYTPGVQIYRTLFMLNSRTIYMYEKRNDSFDVTFKMYIVQSIMHWGVNMSGRNNHVGNCLSLQWLPSAYISGHQWKSRYLCNVLSLTDGSWAGPAAGWQLGFFTVGYCCYCQKWRSHLNASPLGGLSSRTEEEAARIDGGVHHEE